MYRRGKYLIYDLADFICYYFESKRKQYISHYQIQYILIYAAANYLNKYDEYLIYEDYELESSKYGFLYLDLFYNSKYNNSYTSLSTPIETKMVYPNKYTDNEISDLDKAYLENICDKLALKPVKDFQEEMVSMNCYKESVSSLTNIKNKFITNKIITIEEIAKELL